MSAISDVPSGATLQVGRHSWDPDILTKDDWIDLLGAPVWHDLTQGSKDLSDQPILTLERPPIVKYIVETWLKSHREEAIEYFRTITQLPTRIQISYSLMQLQIDSSSYLSEGFTGNGHEGFVLLPLQEWTPQTGCFIDTKINPGDDIRLKGDHLVSFPAKTNAHCISITFQEKK